MIDFTLNGKRRRYRGAPFKRLLDVVREDFSLTGTKEGCGEGECGACTVLVDGEPVNSCLIPVCQMGQRSVETIESVGTPSSLHTIQRAFLTEGGAQCGICTPGMVLTAHAYVRKGGKMSDASIREALAGNLCRCTGYQHIVRAVASAVATTTMTTTTTRAQSRRATTRNRKSRKK
jgi:carbon-monoxide dehydrogenase small subunit